MEPFTLISSSYVKYLPMNGDPICYCITSEGYYDYYWCEKTSDKNKYGIIKNEKNEPVFTVLNTRRANDKYYLLVVSIDNTYSKEEIDRFIEKWNNTDLSI